MWTLVGVEGSHAGRREGKEGWWWVEVSLSSSSKEKERTGRSFFFFFLSVFGAVERERWS